MPQEAVAFPEGARVPENVFDGAQESSEESDLIPHAIMDALMY